MQEPAPPLGACGRPIPCMLGRAWVGYTPSSVSVYLVSPIWCDKARSRSRFNGCVPHTQHIKLSTVGQPE